MAQKIYVLILYGLCLLGCIALPIYAANLKGAENFETGKVPENVGLYKFYPLIIFLYGSLFIAGHYSYLSIFVAISVIFFTIYFFVIKLFKRRKICLSVGLIFLSCLFSITLPWWRRQSGGLTISWLEALSYLFITTVCCYFLLRKNNQRKIRWGFSSIICLFLFFLWIALDSFGLGLTENGEVLLTMWHHWGAYIAPSESIISGARPFFDVPIQYGFGPALLIIMGCKFDCWSGAYVIFATTAFIYALLIGLIAIFIDQKSSIPKWLLFLFISFSATLWIALPSNLANPLLTPSTSGMRFLPPVIIAAWCLFMGKDILKYSYVGSSLWLLGLMWSPESAFSVSVIWGSQFLFCVASDAQSRNYSATLKALGKLTITFLMFVAVIFVLYRLIFDANFDIRVFLAYMLHPPGEMPINLRGPVWFFMFSFGLSAISSYLNWKKHRDVNLLRQSFLLQVLALATFSYFLGRSHDNNILNLMPFMCLLLLDACINTRNISIKISAAVALSSLVAWAPVFNWTNWNIVFSQKSFAEFNFLERKQLLNYSDSAGSLAKRTGMPVEKLVEGDKLMQRIHAQGEKFEFLDVNLDLQPKYGNNTWAGMHGPANFDFIPSDMRRTMMLRAKLSLNKSGWVIVDKTYPSADKWLVDFDSIYTRVGLIEGPYYYAIKYSP